MTRWGILGTGNISTQFVNDLRLLPDAEVVAVGSRSIETATAFAGKHGIPRAYGSWADFAADGDIDIVYVGIPHSAHYEATLTCLNGGRPVLCEKPFTLDRASSAELVRVARERDLFLMEAMWMRCDPLILRIAALAADGAIGQVTSVHADFGAAGPFPPEHRMRARTLGGGALLDLGVYPVSLAYLLLGRPDHVRAWAKLTPEGVDENTGIVFGYDSGAVAVLSCGLLGATPNTAAITGTQGRIELPSGFFRPGHAVLHRAGADVPETLTRTTEAGYHHEAAEAQECLRAGRIESRLVPHEATLTVMGLLDEIREQIGVHYH